MIHHFSIPASNPERVARVFAELWRGSLFPFPVAPRSFIVLAGDERGTAVEVYPDDVCLVPGVGEAGPATPDASLAPWEVQMSERNPAPRAISTHAAIASVVEEAEVKAIAAREGWRAVTCDRGPAFRVVELWLENRVLIEVLTPSMRGRYLDFMQPKKLAALLGG